MGSAYEADVAKELSKILEEQVTILFHEDASKHKINIIESIKVVGLTKPTRYSQGKSRTPELAELGA